MVCELTAPVDATDQIEAKLLELPQIDCPVLHHFGPGVYIREVRMPAGSLILGHRHKNAHTNILVSGRLKFLNEGGEVVELAAPAVIKSNPGRKLAFILEDTIWQNVYATEERDIETLEVTLLDKSDAWLEHKDKVFKLQQSLHTQDHSDFKEVIAAFGMDEEFVDSVSRSEEDQIAFPEGSAPKVTLRPSPIHGTGVFASFPISAFEVIGPARLDGKRTPLGRYTNHSANPNAFFVKNDNGDIYAMAFKDIRGCSGGDNGEEVTVDYMQALKINGYQIEGDIK
jgi:hypothetical protein